MTTNPLMAPPGSTTTATPKMAVYFDGSCPMCTAEICFYKARPGGDRVEWVDISALPPGSMVGPDLTKSAAMARFHVRGPDGKLTSGAAAFALLWTALPGFQWAGRIAGLPGIVHGVELAYRAFLPIRPWLQRRMIARLRKAG